MGYIRHHAIVVTSWNDEMTKLAHKKATEIFENTVSSIVKSKTNGYDSFFIGPDGSKEGWDESEEGDRRRTAFIKWVRKQDYEDGSNPLDYVELFYGDDDGESKIIRHN